MWNVDPKLVAIGIFLATYLLIILFYHWKTPIVWASVALLLLAKLLSPGQALASINWNVIFLYFGMLFVSEVFLYSKMPDYLATLFASRAPSVRVAMVILCAFTGCLSVVLENVAVVLLVAPIALAISKKCGISPVPLFIGMAISSNLQGAATLIGDPPSMLLAGYAGLSFNDFFVIDGKPSMFFAVQVGALVSVLVLYMLFRKYDRKLPPLERTPYDSLVPAILVLLLVAALALSSSFQHGVKYMAGLICCVFGAISFAWYLWHSRARNVSEFTAKLDWQTGLFLMGIFILVESLSAAGVMGDLANLILRISGGNPFFVYGLIVWVSVGVSAFVDNVPFLVAMLAVTRTLIEQTGLPPHLLYFGLLLGASVGGNVTPIGASANIVAMGIVRKQGHETTFGEFVRIGLPFTVAAVLASSLFVWFIFA
jgi:Na+/H+ antiporter NhaD/arsenite permease-like protein